MTPWGSEFISSFVLVIDRETGSINECQRSHFLLSVFLHAITAARSIAHQGRRCQGVPVPPTVAAGTPKTDAELLFF